MPQYSRTSRDRLVTCDERLQAVFNKVILHYDCSVLCGHRGEQEQTKAFQEGRSKVRFPDSKHNRSPSMAADVVPYPVVWPETRRMLARLSKGEVTITQTMMTMKDLARFYYFGGYVLGVAQEMGVPLRLGIPLRWGGDWDGDRDIHEQTFDDLPHFELIL